MTKLSIQGILYDEKSSFQKGPALAPPLIRKVLYDGSSNMFSENGMNLNDANIRDLGDHEIEDYFQIESITRNLLKDADKIFTLGGDHSITYPIIKAVSEKFKNLYILQIDAHPDLYQSFEGDIYSHACPFARIMENNLAVHLTQFGIRGYNSHQKNQAAKFNVTSFEMKDILEIPKLQFPGPLYISLDLDGLDPAFAPGVSHHEPGGLSTRQVIQLIHQIEGEVIGADLVEYNPNRDNRNQTTYVAAKLMKELIGKILSKKY